LRAVRLIFFFGPFGFGFKWGRPLIDWNHPDMAAPSACRQAVKMEVDDTGARAWPHNTALKPSSGPLAFPFQDIGDMRGVVSHRRGVAWLWMRRKVTVGSYILLHVRRLVVPEVEPIKRIAQICRGRFGLWLMPCRWPN
jgi:hypothetical protein